MASTIGTTPGTVATYGVLSSQIKTRLAAGTFTTLTGPEEAALLDTALGVAEKNGDPLGAALLQFENPRAGLLEAHYVTPGSLIGG